MKLDKAIIAKRISEIKNFAQFLNSEKFRIAKYLVEKTGLTISNKLWEVDFVVLTLNNIKTQMYLLENRLPSGTKAIFLPYNAPLFSFAVGFAAAYLSLQENETILVKFPTNKLPDISSILEQSSDMFLHNVRFFNGSGKEFIKEIMSLNISTTLIFGHHSWVEPLEPLVRVSNQKLIFEGE